MSTNTYRSGSVHSSREGFVNSRTGSSRPSRPAQIDPALAEQISGGVDPQTVDEMSHVSAAALLDHVHHTQDPQVVQRVLTLVDREGVDIIAELWSHAEPDSLPGMLWRLYLLRTWMRKNGDSMSQLWRIGEPVATSASAVAGIDTSPNENDIARTADSILSGAFTGDFAVALERAAAFTDVVAKGLHIEARHVAHSGSSDQDVNDIRSGAHDHSHSAESRRDPQTTASRLMHTASNLMVTSQDFAHGADLWRQGKLE